MSARVRRHGEQQNLDSLLDTMANVTGILVVLLAVTQISVGDAMGRLRDQLLARPELSRESLAAAASEAEDLRARLAPLRDGRAGLESGLRDGRGELAGLDRRIATLEDEIERLRAQPRSAAEAERQVAAVRGRARELEQALAREQAVVAALERELASLPSAPVARDARLPDSRLAPPGSSPVYYGVRYGRVQELDATALVEALESGVWRAAHATDRRTLGDPRLRAQVIDFFAMRDVGDRDFRWRMFDEGGELYAHLEWRHEGVGETLAELEQPDSRFRRSLARLDRMRTALQFFVWDDSFEVYLAARRLSDRAGLSAGWDPRAPEEPLRQPVTGPGPRGAIID